MFGIKFNFSLLNKGIEISQKIVLILFYFFPLIITSISILLVFYWLYLFESISSYDKAVIFIKTQFEHAYLIDYLDQYFFHKKQFLLIKNHSFLIGITGVFIFGLVGICNFFMYKNEFSTLSFSGIKPILKSSLSILILWLVLKIFLYNYLPLHIDETFDYVYYSSKSFLLRHTYIFHDESQWYNNHIFLSDLSAVFSFVGLPAKVSIRLPSILAELTLFIYFIHFFKENKKLLFVILTGILVHFWLSIYSVQGRSYFLMTLSALILIFESFKQIKEKNPSFLLFTFFSIVGLISNKLFVLPFIAIFSFLVIHSIKEKKLFQLFAPAVIIFFTVFSFYSPSLLIGGKSSFYEPILDIESLTFPFSRILELLSLITSVDSKVYLFSSFWLILVIIRLKYSSKLTRFLFTHLVAQFLIIILYSLISFDYLPSRSLLPVSALFLITTLSFFWDFISSMKQQKQWLFIVALLSLLSLNTLFQYNYGWVNNYTYYVLDKANYLELDKNIDLIASEKPQKIYIDPECHFYLFYIQYHYLKKEMFISSKIEDQKSCTLWITKDLLTNQSLFFYDDFLKVNVYFNDN